LQDTLKL